MKRPGPAIALAVVVAVNLAMLLGVWQARRAEPDATLVLDERELRLGRAGAEATTVVLTFARHEGKWTDRRLIESLGFDISAHSPDPQSYAIYRGVLPRQVFVVCELGGDTWKQRVAEAHALAVQAAAAGPATATPVPSLEELMARASRLVEVDLGTDADALRVRYPDRARHLILPAVVGLRAPVPRTGQPVEPFAVNVHQVFPSQVIVPTALRPAIDGLDASVTRLLVTTLRPEATRWVPDLAKPPRYEVVLAVDASLQPRILEIEPLSGTSAGPAAPSRTR